MKITRPTAKKVDIPFGDLSAGDPFSYDGTTYYMKIQPRETKFTVNVVNLSTGKVSFCADCVLVTPLPNAAFHTGEE